MIKILLEFDNKTYIYEHINNKNNKTNIHNDNPTLLDIFSNTLTDNHKQHLIKYINYYYFIHNHKLIKHHTFINDIVINDNYNSKNINNECIAIKCRIKHKGGFIPGLDDAIGILFKPIISPFEAIGNFFVMLFGIVVWLAKFTWWLIQFLFWVVLDLLNPLNFLGDFFNTLIILVLAFCRLPVDIFMTLLSFSVNLMGTWMQGFWGWDQSGLTKQDRESNYFQKLNKNKGKKCYLTNSNTVPFSVVLGTILCPPIGVFMDMGLTGWLNIIVCILLTLLFYIPGLVYALLVIYS